MAHYLKTMGINQLVGMDMLGSTNNQQIDFQSITLPDIDVVGINYYDSRPNDSYKVSTIVDNICQLRGSVVPVVQAEEGIMDPYRDCSNNALEAPDIMLRGFTKVGAYYHWYGYDRHLDFDYNTYWKHTIRTQYHLDGYDVISALSENNGQWTQVRDERALSEDNYQKDVFNIKKKKDWGIFKDNNPWFSNAQTKPLIELQYYISNDKKTVVGYIKNRTFNIYTKRNTEDAAACGDLGTDFNFQFPFNQLIDLKNEYLFKFGKKDKNIILTDLNKKENYRFDFYRLENYISTSIKKSDKDKKVILEFPDLSVSNGNNQAVVWFVGHEEEKNMLLLPNTAMETEQQVSELTVLDKDTNESEPMVTPNPFTNELTITSPTKDNIKLISIEGVEIISQSISSGSTDLALNRLAQGIYILHFINQNKTFKILKL